MASLPKTSRALFKKWGKQGGDKRGKMLSPGRRHSIASLAARSRWGENNAANRAVSVRLENPSWEDPVYIVEILDEGGLAQWRQLYRRVPDHPFGKTPQSLEKVVGNAAIYGA